MDGAEQTSWTLIDAAAKGRAEDRERVARLYAPLVRRYLAARWRLSGDHEQVQEGVQDAMLQLFKPGGALQNADPAQSGGFRAYLYGLVRNVALMIERSARRRQDRSEPSGIDLDHIEQSEATLSQVFDREWARMIAQRARVRMLENLRGKQPDAEGEQKHEKGQEIYRCLELRYTEGLAPRDIAEQLGRDVKVVYELLRSARNEYRRALLETVGEFYPGRTYAELEDTCRELTRFF